MIDIVKGQITNFSISTKNLSGGLALALLIAACSQFLSDHYGAPTMLFALLIGMAFNYLADHEKCAAGIEFSSKTLLRIGVALLGFRLSFEEITAIGVLPAATTCLLVFCTIGAGLLVARLFGFRPSFGLLAGGSVAICGASAALAISSVVPKKSIGERDVLFVVIAVTTLSTIAMVSYPIIFGLMGISDTAIGFLLGATIHDVAQVIGAGYSVSGEAGDTATFIKMLRVAMLPLVMILITLASPARQGSKLHLPWFLVAFILFTILGNMVALPETLLNSINDFSRWLLVTAISALGVKTALSSILTVGGKQITLVVGVTVLLLILAMSAVPFLAL